MLLRVLFLGEGSTALRLVPQPHAVLAKLEMVAVPHGRVADRIPIELNPATKIDHPRILRRSHDAAVTVQDVRATQPDLAQMGLADEDHPRTHPPRWTWIPAATEIQDHPREVLLIGWYRTQWAAGIFLDT